MPLESNVSLVIHLFTLVKLTFHLDAPVELRPDDLLIELSSRKVLLLRCGRFYLHSPRWTIVLAIVAVAHLGLRSLDRPLVLAIDEALYVSLGAQQVFVKLLAAILDDPAFFNHEVLVVDDAHWRLTHALGASI